MTGREIKNVEVIAYSSFNIVSNQGGRKRWVMYIGGSREVPFVAISGALNGITI